MYKTYVKRFLDIILALITSPFFCILFIIIAPIIYFENKGPIFYNAERLGKNGEIFKMYKFRSMKVNALDIRNEDGSTFNSEDDPRVTRIGRFLRKTSLDELPQIINILKNKMSFIGPRPDLVDSQGIYNGYDIRKLEVIPGITGYNQAYFRNSIPANERLENDIYYVDHISFWVDVKIFIKTVVILFQRKNVFISSKELTDDKVIAGDQDLNL